MDGKELGSQHLTGGGIKKQTAETTKNAKKLKFTVDGEAKINLNNSCLLR